MSQLELDLPSENHDWAPALVLRPHHVYSPEVATAIKGRNIFRDAKVYMRSIFREIRDRQDAGFYIEDTYGIGNTETKVEAKRQVFYDEIRALPDNAVVHLDMNPDMICKTCPIGKHCRSTNVVRFGSLSQAPAAEAKFIQIFEERLRRKGFQEGEDFAFKDTTSELENYNGEKLWGHSAPPVPKTVVFRSMLIKMGVLRSII
jgi:hypothetical protein